jgi:HD-like signal output (HDOD) protein
LWRNAVSAAIIATDISEIKGVKQGSVPFTGALLRDIGKVIMDPHLLSAKEQILERINTQGLTFMDAERQIFGFDHAQLSEYIAKKWNFPIPLQCVLRYYHRPLEAKGCFLEASIVHLADAICRKMEIGLGVDDAHYPEDERVSRSLGLDDAQIQGVIDDFGRKMERVNALFYAA